MDELREIHGRLERLKHLLNHFIMDLDRLPPYMVGGDPYAFLDDVKYICGYVDCMIENGIELLPEKEYEVGLSSSTEA